MSTSPKRCFNINVKVSCIWHFFFKFSLRHWLGNSLKSCFVNKVFQLVNLNKKSCWRFPSSSQNSCSELSFLSSSCISFYVKHVYLSRCERVKHHLGYVMLLEEFSDQFNFDGKWRSTRLPSIDSHKFIVVQKPSKVALDGRWSYCRYPFPSTRV